MIGEATYANGTKIIPFSDSQYDKIKVQIKNENIDGTRDITGQIFSMEIGWIYFDNSTGDANNDQTRVYVDTDGYLAGKAWNNNIGWFMFDKEILQIQYALEFGLSNLDEIVINGQKLENNVYLKKGTNRVSVQIKNSSGKIYYWFDPLGKYLGYEVDVVTDEADENNLTLSTKDENGDDIIGRSNGNPDDLVLHGTQTAERCATVNFDIKLPASNISRSGIDSDGNTYKPEAPNIDGLGVLSVKIPGEKAFSYNLSAYTRGALDDSNTRDISGSIYSPAVGYIELKDAKVQTKGFNAGAITGHGWNSNIGYVFFEHPTLKEDGKPLPMIYIDPHHANRFVNDGEKNDKDGISVNNEDDITDYLRGEVYSPTIGMIRLAKNVPGDANIASVKSGIADGGSLSVSHNFNISPDDVSDSNHVSPAGFVYFGGIKDDILDGLVTNTGKINLDTVSVEYDFDDDINTERIVHKYDADRGVVAINRQKAFKTDETTQKRQFALVDVKFSANGLSQASQVEVINTDDYIKCDTNAATDACTITKDADNVFTIANLRISSLQQDSTDSDEAKVQLNPPTFANSVQAPHEDEPYIRKPLNDLKLKIYAALDSNNNPVKNPANGNIQEASFAIANYEPILSVSKLSTYNDGLRTSRNGSEEVKHTTVIRNLASQRNYPRKLEFDSINFPYTISANTESKPIALPRGSTVKDLLLKFTTSPTNSTLRVYDQNLNKLDTDLTLAARPTGPLPYGISTSDYNTLSSTSNVAGIGDVYVTIEPASTVTLNEVAVMSSLENDFIDIVEVKEKLPDWTKIYAEQESGDLDEKHQVKVTVNEFDSRIYIDYLNGSVTSEADVYPRQNYFTRFGGIGGIGNYNQNTNTITWKFSIEDQGNINFGDDADAGDTCVSLRTATLEQISTAKNNIIFNDCFYDTKVYRDKALTIEFSTKIEAQ